MFMNENTTTGELGGSLIAECEGAIKERDRLHMQQLIMEQQTLLANQDNALRELRERETRLNDTVESMRETILSQSEVISTQAFTIEILQKRCADHI